MRLPSERVLLHQQLAAYFSPMPVSGRRLEELPWHLERAGMWGQLKAEMESVWLTVVPTTLTLTHLPR